MMKIKDIVDIDEFLKTYKKDCQYVFAFYDEKDADGSIVGVPFCGNLLAIKRQISQVSYCEPPKNEIYLFPKEFDLICLGYFDDKYSFKSLNVSFGSIFGLLSNNQKMQYVANIENPIVNKSVSSLNGLGVQVEEKKE